MTKHHSYFYLDSLIFLISWRFVSYHLSAISFFFFHQRFLQMLYLMKDYIKPQTVITADIRLIISAREYTQRLPNSTI